MATAPKPKLKPKVQAVWEDIIEYAKANPFKATGEPSPASLYGRGYEGHPLFQQSPDAEEAALLAGKRALSGGGFDPARILLSREMPGTPDAYYAGAYIPSKDLIVAGATAEGRIAGGPSTLVHEAAHRSLNLAENYIGELAEDSTLKQVAGDQHWEEVLMRTLEHYLAGTEPSQAEKQQWPEIGSEKALAALDELEDLLRTTAQIRHDAGGGRMGPR